MRAVIFGLLLSFSLPAFAWSDDDQARENTIMVLSLVDMSQTLYIVKHPEYYESNPVLGNHPKKHEVYRYFLTTMVGHQFVARILPEEYRKPFQYISIGFEGTLIARNLRLGIGFSF